MEKKTRDKSKKRKTILDGAVIVFIEDGYEQASMDKIAEIAGVSKKTVYNHFGSKETLFQSIIDDFLEQRQKLKTIEYNNQKPLSEQLRAFALAEIFLINTPKRSGLSRLLTIEFLQNLEFTKTTVAGQKPHLEMLTTWLIVASNHDKIATDNPLLTARMFYSMVEGCITWPALFTQGITEEYYNPLLDEIIDIFLAKYGV